MLARRVALPYKWFCPDFTSPAKAAGTTGRRNTIQCIDSAMRPRENQLFRLTWPMPSQGSVPTGLALPSDFGFCFQYKVRSSLVLRAPFETTAFIRHVDRPAWSVIHQPSAP